MSFCTKCGKQNEANVQFCTGCGEAIAAQAAAASDGVAAPAASSSPIGADFAAAIKRLFSGNPENTVLTAGEAKSQVWALLGGIYLLVLALYSVTITSQMFPAAMREWLDINLANVFFSGLVSGALNIVIIAGVMKLLLVCYKTNASFVKVLNIVAAATLIYSLTALIGLVFSFIDVTAITVIGGILPLFGIIAFLGLIYKGMKSCESKISPVWAWAAILFAFLVAQFLPMLWDGQVGGNVLDMLEMFF